MRLEPLYRVTFRCPEHWHAELDLRGYGRAGPVGNLDVAELVWEEIP